MTGPRFFYGALAALATLALVVLAYYAVHEMIGHEAAGERSTLEYDNVITILLTTVTVIFTVSALALAVLGVIGYRNLKRDAGRFAESQAVRKINDAFAKGGTAYDAIDQQLQDDGGHFKPWAEKRIRAEVIERLPRIIDERAQYEDSGLAEGEPTDEGEVE